MLHPMTRIGMKLEHLLKTIFDQVLIPVIVMDAEHRVVYANENGLQVFGVPRNAEFEQPDAR